jgi:hypothetical protein
MVQNVNWLCRECTLVQHLQRTNVNHMCRITNKMSQNRYMKNTVQTPQRIRQAELIFHVSFLFHNFERYHKPRRELRTLSKLDQNLMRFHPQENSVSHFIIMVNAICISINILSIFYFLNIDLLCWRFHPQ